MGRRSVGVPARGRGVVSRRDVASSVTGRVPGAVVNDPMGATTPHAAGVRDTVELPEGAAVFDADWTIVSVNEPGARLLGRRRERLVGRNLWIALPELGGTILHSFLLHARRVGERVTWQGFYPPAGRWFDATAYRVEDRLHVTFRDAGHRLDPAVVDPDHEAPTRDPEADYERLR